MLAVTNLYLPDTLITPLSITFTYQQSADRPASLMCWVGLLGLNCRARAPPAPREPSNQSHRHRHNRHFSGHHYHCEVHRGRMDHDRRDSVRDPAPTRDQALLPRARCAAARGRAPRSSKHGAVRHYQHNRRLTDRALNFAPRLSPDDCCVAGDRLRIIMSSIMRRRSGLISAIENSCLMRWFGNTTLSDRKPRRQLPLPEVVSFNPRANRPRYVKSHYILY